MALLSCYRRASRSTLLSSDRQLNNLPIALTSFVGRVGERAEIARLLPSARLLTLTGAGGSGKTCLALAVAAEWAGYPHHSIAKAPATRRLR
jgi:hypothetical protein